MIRTVAATVLGCLILVSSIFAKDVKGTFVKYEEGSLTVKVDDKETTFKTDENSVIVAKKNVPSKNFSKVFAKVKEGAKLELKVSDKDVVEEIKMLKKGGKNKTDK